MSEELPQRYAWMKPGVKVWYTPVLAEQKGFAGTIRSEPWQLDSGHWVVHLHKMTTAWHKDVVYAVPLPHVTPREEVFDCDTDAKPGHRERVKYAEAKGALAAAKKDLAAAEERLLYATGWTRHPTIKDNWQYKDTVTHRCKAVEIQLNQEEGEK